MPPIEVNIIFLYFEDPFKIQLTCLNNRFFLFKQLLLESYHKSILAFQISFVILAESIVFFKNGYKKDLIFCITYEFPH